LSDNAFTTTKKDGILQEDEEEVETDGEDGEEIRKIAGKEIEAKLESDELMLHLVSTSLNNLHDIQ
jgi:hypothetical protein